MNNPTVFVYNVAQAPFFMSWWDEIRVMVLWMVFSEYIDDGWHYDSTHTKFHTRNGKVSYEIEGKPAVVKYENVGREWWTSGALDRQDGPAVLRSGVKYWKIAGVDLKSRLLVWR